MYENKQINQINQIIRTCLSSLGMHSPSAERLLLGTGAVESRYLYLRQWGNAFARSYWQVEPPTALDNIHNYLVFRKKKLNKVAEVCMITPELILGLDDNSVGQLLEINLNFAICMARIKYWRVPKRLPKHDDIDGLGEYWLKYYNAGGKGSRSKWNEAQEMIK